MQFDYTVVGHVTCDMLPDGQPRAGGTALYSALQASRLGLRTLIHTRGVAAEIESLMRPYRGEVEVVIEPAAATTTLASTGAGRDRRQQMLSWAGVIETRGPFASAILHLAPVARELAGSWGPHAGFMGLTPQGLVRDWAGPGGYVRAVAAGSHAVELAELCNALVLSEQERESCCALFPAAARAGALIAITAGEAPTRLRLPDGQEHELPVTPLRDPADDIGAGDVYACAFFIALSEGHSPVEAAAFAAAAAAERMTGVGPQAIAARAEILARLDASDERP